MPGGGGVLKSIGPIHAILITCALLLSVVAGRQIFMDGASFVTQSLLDPFTWYPPHDTPKRFFAIMWTTAAVRLLGVFDPSRINAAIILFGLATYSQIAIPFIAIVRSELKPVVRSLIIVCFTSGTIFLANFAVTELLFAIALTTLFVIYTLDPAQDAKLRKRFVLAFLLMASYEIVVISNVALAVGTYFFARDEERPAKSYVVLIGILALGPAFQIACYLVGMSPQAKDVFDWFVFVIAGVFIAALAVLIAYFKLIETVDWLRTASIFLAFAIPASAMFTPFMLGLRTREFQFSYPSRIYTAGIIVIIAMLPLLLNRRLWRWPWTILEWIERPLNDLGLAMVAAFCGVSLLASADAFRYFARLDKELSSRAGVIDVASCDFCVQPTKYGLPNLGYIWLWPVYGMIHTLEHPELPPVVVIGPAGVINGDISSTTVATFMEHQLALRGQPPLDADALKSGLDRIHR
jgi:hypothetical protein